MIFKSIKAQNFMSFKELDLNLENRGLLLINGKNLDNPALNNNGAGKSSILEAIVYALYGRTLRGLKGDSVIHQGVGKNTKVFLDLEDNGDTYRIARYRKHSVNKNKSLLYRNGKDITPKSEADLERYISELLQTDYNSFTASLLYSAESFKFATATDSEIKKAFDTMLGLDTYSKALELTRQSLRQVSLEETKLNSAIQVKQNTLDNTNNKVTQLQLNSSSFAQKTADKITECEVALKTLEEETQDLEEDIEDLKENKNLREKKLKKAEDKLAQCKSDVKQLTKLREELQKLELEQSKAEGVLKSQKFHLSFLEKQMFGLNSDKADKQKKIQELETTRDSLSEKIGQPCPLCGHLLTKQNIEVSQGEYNAQIDAISDEIKIIDKSIEGVDASLITERKAISAAEAQIAESIKTQQEFKKLLKSGKVLEDDQSAAEELVDKIKQGIYKVTSDIRVKTVTFKNTVASIENLKKEISDLRVAKNPYEDMITTCKEEITTLSKDLAANKEKLEKLEKEKSYLRFWENGFSNSGIKSYILDDVTPFLNYRLNKYLTKLTSGQIEAKFSTTSTLKTGEQREKFNLSIVNNHGGDQYLSNSGGERKRIDLAINLALQDLVASRSTKKLNIAIFDEVFDALDENGVDGVVSLLQELSEEKSTILVVSHNEYLKSFFTNCITVTKKDGFSLLEGDES